MIDIPLIVELELFRKGQLTADDEEEELEDPKAVAALTEASNDPGKSSFILSFLIIIFRSLFLSYLSCHVFL